jgi:flagellar hook-basal body complex protein FliE
VTVAINPISAMVSGALGSANASGTSSADALRAATGASTTERTSGTSSTFGRSLVEALDGLEATQDHADDLAEKAATGDLVDVHDNMISATEASLATELTVAIRNRAIESFNEIMRMQV